MKKLFFTMLALLPLTLWAQDNSWELNEDEDVKTEVKAKTKVDPKYLKGAVPEVDGQVVFSKHIEAPGKTASQIYDIMLQYMERLTKTSNQIDSKIASSDAQKHEIIGAYQEWLVFKKSALSYDRTRFFYALRVTNGTESQIEYSCYANGPFILTLITWVNSGNMWSQYHFVRL